MAPPRILSLLPSCTEIVCLLGRGANLVGRSHECDYPPEIATLPVCTKTRLNPAKSEAEIDLEVQTALREARSLYTVNVALVSELQPDIILTQAQCQACAISASDLERALAGQLDYSPKILSVETHRFANLWENIMTVAEAIGIAEEARPIVKQLKVRLVNVIEKVAEAVDRPRVGCLEWLDPLMAAGNWIPDLVEMAGGRNAFGEAGKLSPKISWATLANQNPDVLVAMPCGFDLARSRADLAALARRPEWASLRAARNKKAFVVDGSQYFNRPGPRLVDSVEILAEIIHPGKFPARHRGGAWEPQ
jgi:iron complex transport system substrate-binding protein